MKNPVCLKMAAPMPRDLATAAAQGDIHVLRSLIQNGADVNKRSKDGMSPLSIAAFWGYADIAKCLLDHGADINAQNSGTRWSPLHCAAFQGHGPVIMKLMHYQPDLALPDMRGRTAADFASALDSIWPFFAAAGCKRTPKSELIKMDIVQKVSPSYEQSTSREDLAHFSRPGSSYAMRSQMPASHRDPNMEMAAITGDVLASLPEEPTHTYNSTSRQPHLMVWNN